MEIPKEILVVPLKEKKPLIKNKRKALKFAGTFLSVSLFALYIYYYPAPKEFSFKNAVSIGALLGLVFSTSLSISYFFISFRKSLLIAALVTATLTFRKSQIITIITYAICFPLLFIKTERKVGEARPLPEKHD